jgi:hypothetical protein
MPKELLQRFGIYRLSCTIIAIIQYTIICRTKLSGFCNCWRYDRFNDR